MASKLPQGYARHLAMLKGITCSIPSKNLQTRIAKAITACEKYISFLHSLISKYEFIKKSTVKMMLTPNAEWSKATLGDYYSVSSGLSKKSECFGTGHPFVSFSTIFNNPILPTHVEDLVESSNKERQKCSVHQGDIFLTRTSETLDELGMSSVALKDIPNATFNGFSKRLRPQNNKIPLYPLFMAYFLRTNTFRQNINRLSAMTTRASLSGELIKQLPIQYPSIDEQIKIATQLSELDRVIEKTNKGLNKARSIKRGLMNYFFS